MTAVIDPHEPDKHQMIQDLIDAHIVFRVIDVATGKTMIHFNLIAIALYTGVSEFRLITEAACFAPGANGVYFTAGSKLAQDAQANSQKLAEQYNSNDPIVIIWHEAWRKNIL